MIQHNLVQFGFESIITLFIVIISFLIFKKTKDIANLSGKNSVKLFRYSFLFFGIAYLLRLLLFMFKGTSLIIFFGRGINRIIMDITLPFILLFSFIAIMMLTTSTIRKFDERKNIIKHIITISSIIALLSLIYLSIIVVFFVEIVMVIISIIILFKNKTKKRKNPKKIYLLLFLFWVFSIGTMIPLKHIIPPEIKIIPQLISAIIFIIIFRKVTKWIK